MGDAMVYMFGIGFGTSMGVALTVLISFKWYLRFKKKQAKKGDI